MSSANVQNNNKERLVLLDAHAVIHRAYHALPDFATSRGEPTGALYGLVLMILKIVADLRPDYLVACYDLPGGTYRHEVYEKYKAGRAKIDDDLTVQLEKSKKICEAVNIPIYSKEGFEADDILGTIVEKLKIENSKLKIPVDIIIASGDMDTLQLVDNEKVQVYTLKKGIKDPVLYNEKAVKERFGFGPELLPDFKGLRGDPSDNIVGVEGIGEKTATELIKKFGTIENLYKKLKAKNEKQKVDIKPRIFKLLEENEEEAKFSKMLATIRRDAPLEFKLPKKRWKDGIDLEKAKKLFNELEFRTMGEKLKAALDKKNDKQNLENKNEEKSEDNSVDAEELEEVKLALWVTDSNITNPKKEDIFNFANVEFFNEAKKIIFEELDRRGGREVFGGIEKPLLPLVKEMEDWGVLADGDFLERLEKDYSEELKKIEEKIWKEAGEKFNVSSPKQLGEILFDKLNLTLKYQKKTSTGAKSTKESELQKMKNLHLIVPLVLEYRELSKLLTTYIIPIQKMLDENSRLHAHFILSGSATGRMASENPNLQNIPIGSEKGRAIRKAFIAPTGSKLIALDYSQIELRVAAIMSGDKKLTNIFKEGKDVHSTVASEVFRVKEDEVTKEMRRQAKVINFGILYGMGVNALSQNLESDRKTAQKFLEDYFKNFSGLAEYLDKTKKEAEKNGYTETLFGRKRYFEGLKSKIPYIKAAAERMAINAPLQGTAADVIKIAMRRIDDFLKESRLSKSAHLIMQVHDELVYEVEENAIDKFKTEAKHIMESVLTPSQSHGVPLVTNVSMGDNLGNLD